MANIKIKLENDCFLFSKDDDIVNRKGVLEIVVNKKALKSDNIDLINILKKYSLKYKINKVIIQNLEIADSVLQIIKDIPSILNIEFIEDKVLNYKITYLILENKNLKNVYCYDIPKIMYNRFDDLNIESRHKIKYESEFTRLNKIKSYSEILRLNSIKINNNITNNDLKIIDYALKLNLRIKKIEIYKYSKEVLKFIVGLLIEMDKKSIIIDIIENPNNTKNILGDKEYIKKISDDNNIEIKIKYSKEYIEKNSIKQLNLTLMKFSAICITIISLVFIIIFYYKDYKSTNNLEKNLNSVSEISDVMNEIIEYDKDENMDNVELNIVEDDTNSYNVMYSEVYDDLIKINEDTIGWLKLNDTNINYPVVQSNNNSYYLNHSFDKTSNKAGWIFADYRNDFEKLSDNTIIYAHNLKNGYLFGSLKKVLDSSWYNNKENLIINFSVKGKIYNWQIFSIYSIENTNDYLVTDFSTKESFMHYMKLFKERSIRNFELDVNENDKILTLSTCYKNSNYRLVVHAKKIN